MRTQLLKSIGFTFLFFGLCNASNAQIINDVINVEVGFDRLYMEDPSDGSDPVVEPVIRLTVLLDDVPMINDICLAFPPCEGIPCIYNPPGIVSLGSIGYQDNNAFLSFTMLAYEEDNNDPCVFTQGDDDLKFEGEVAVQPVFPIAWGDPGVWSSSVGGPEGWMNNQNEADVIALDIWRYTHGNTFDDPLSFGELNFTLPSYDKNSNHGPADGVCIPCALSYYTNNGGTYSSPDVYYSFEITDNAQVSISTDYSYTNFDTELFLYDSQGTLIEQSAIDIGSVGASIIVKDLCPGQYKVMVQGKGSSEGLFRISVAASELQIPLSLGMFSSPVNCSDDTNGNVTSFPGGGVPPYELQWNTGDSNVETLNNVGAGIYTLTLTDACETVVTESIEVEIDDEQNPSVSCSDLEIEISEGSNYTLSSTDIENMASASDNCEVESIEINPNEFSADDIGTNTVTITAHDGAGNESSCEATVTISVPTGIADLNSNDFELVVYPNPVSDIMQLKTEQMDSDNFNIQIFDNTGRLVLELNNASKSQGIIDIELSHLNPGIYILSYYNQSSSVQQKFTKL